MKKKGVSPLIATVLLLAFSVSLLTVVIQLNPFSNKCNDVELILKKDVCYDFNDKNIHILLENFGMPINFIKIFIEGTYENTLYEEDLLINTNETTEILIPFDPNFDGKINDLVIIPMILNSKNKLTECRLKNKINSIQAC